MSDIHDRAHAACTDVVAVEHVAPGMVRVVTVHDSYQVDAREERCECPDWEYHLDGDGRCKHLWAALDATDQIDLGRHELVDSLTDSGDTRVLADGGGQWTVVDHERGNRRTYDSRAEAEDALDDMSSLGADDVELVPPGETDGGQESRWLGPALANGPSRLRPARALSPARNSNTRWTDERVHLDGPLPGRRRGPD